MVTKQINKHGVGVEVGQYWTMVVPPGEFFVKDESWIMKIVRVQENGLVPVEYVNWKRNGKGTSNSRMLSDFGEMKQLRRATQEEIEYFDKRWNK